ncbi:MAG TPA: DUF5668 domain-containing protein [Candidatus Limnocylindrales bacterium]|nr:DUF5668 domain-containing protein [Candidatus Limnocylindrales bacterium]
MSIDRGFLGWGVFLILLGGIPLAVNQGWLDASVVEGAWQLWPVIIIGLGISLAARRTPLEPIGGLVVAATFGIMLGSVFVAGFRIPALGGCGIGDGGGTAFAGRDGSLGAAARVQVELNCGELVLATAAGTGWTVTGRDDDGVGPDVEATASSLRVASRDRTPFFGDHDEWEVTLPTDAMLDLEVSVNAGSGRVDLGGANTSAVSLDVNAGDIDADLDGAASVESLTVSVNAGSAQLTLPDASLRGSVSANAGSVELCRSAETAIRITTSESITSSYDFPGLVQRGDTYESPGFADADVRIELDASANAGSIALDPEGGCHG